MRTKRVLALVLSIMLMLVFSTTTGFAFITDDGVLQAPPPPPVEEGEEPPVVDPTIKIPTLSLELFDSTFTKTTIDAVKAAPSATFYLAIKATNFDYFAGMLEDGVTNLYIPVNFNTDVFEIGEPTIRGSNKLTQDSLKTRITDYAKKTGKTITYTGDPTVYACSLLDAPQETTNNPYPGTYKVTPTEIDVNIDVDGDGEVDKRMYQYQLTFGPAGDDPTAAGGMYNEEYVGFIAIKLKSGVSYDDIEDGTASFEFGTRQQDGMAVKIGQTGSNLAYNGADSSLQNYLNLDITAANFFAGQAKKTGITPKTGTGATATKTTGYYDGDELVIGDFIYTWNQEDVDETAVASSDMTYFYADDAGITDVANLTNQITANTNGKYLVTTGMNNKHLYIVADGKYPYCAGQLGVTAISVSSIAVTGTPKQQYLPLAIDNNTGKPDTSGLTVKATNNKGEESTVTASNVVWKYATANNITDATSTDLNALPTKWAAPQSGQKYYLYATYSGKIALAGECTPIPIVPTKIEPSGTVSGAVGAKVVDCVSALKATFTMNAGKYSNKPYSDFASYGAGLFVKNSDNTFTAVDANTTLAANTALVVKSLTDDTVLGNVTVSVDSSAITGIEASSTDSVIAGQKVAAQFGATTSTFKATTTDAGGNTADYKYSQLSGAGITLQIKGSDGNFTAVDANTEFAYGTNTFKVVKGSVSDEFDVTAGDSVTALSTTDTVTYGDALALGSLTVSATYASGKTENIDVTTLTAKAGNPTKYAVGTNNFTFIAESGKEVTLAVTGNKKDITVTRTDLVASAIQVGATTTTGSGSIDLDATKDGIISGDAVTLSYTYEYDDANTATGANEAAVTFTAGSLSGAAAGNYNLTSATLSGNGTVTAASLTGISLNTDSIEYTYPDTIASALATLVITGNYDDGSSMAVTADSMTDPSGATVDASYDLAYGDSVVVTVTVGTFSETFTLTAKKKEISIDNVTFGVTITLGEATIDSADITAGVEAGDDVSIDTSSLSTAVSGESVTISGIALTGADAGKYVLSDNTKTVGGTLGKADQSAPAAPTFTISNKTNKIVITETASPNGTPILYSVDGGTTWNTKAEIEAMDLNRDTPYSLVAKYDGNSNYNPSDASPASNHKSYKNYVELVKSNVVYASIYTDDTTVVDNTALFTLLETTRPSNLKKVYYLDGTEEKEIENYNVTADWTVYYTTSTGNRGGGGGAVTSYTVTYNAGSHGSLAADAKNKETVSINGKPSNIPSVTAAEGWTFKGWSQDGVTVVDPTEVTVKKNVTFTALYEKDGEVEVNPPAIEPTYTKPYVSGYPDGSFMPDNNITRAELAAMMARMINKGDISDDVVSTMFPDVTADKWYSKYVGYLESRNILTGYEDGTFKPDNTVTRAEVCAIIVRAQKMSLETLDDNMFTDITSEHWASAYVATLEARGIVSGYSDGTFAPSAPITRAETVTIINRILEPSTVAGSIRFNDIAGHWAEQDIILAANERQLINQ